MGSILECRRARLLRCLAGLVLVTASSSRADTLVLKNGSTYEGLIRAESPQDVTIHADGADWTFSRDKIASLSKEAGSAARLLAAEKRHQAELAADRPPVIMYSTDWCPVCRRAREYFRESHVRFADYNIDVDHRAKLEMLQKCRSSHFRFRGVPVIDVKGQLMDGFSAGKITSLLARKG